MEPLRVAENQEQVVFKIEQKEGVVLCVMVVFIFILYCMHGREEETPPEKEKTPEPVQEKKQKTTEPDTKKDDSIVFFATSLDPTYKLAPPPKQPLKKSTRTRTPSGKYAKEAKN